MITDKEKLDHCIADDGLAFIQGRYEESLRLANKALQLITKVQMHTNVLETHICLKPIMNQQ